MFFYYTVLWAAIDNLAIRRRSKTRRRSLGNMLGDMDLNVLLCETSGSSKIRAKLS